MAGVGRKPPPCLKSPEKVAATSNANVTTDTKTTKELPILMNRPRIGEGLMERQIPTKYFKKNISNLLKNQKSNQLLSNKIKKQDEGSRVESTEQ